MATSSIEAPQPHAQLSIAEALQLVDGLHDQIAEELPRLHDISARVFQRHGDRYERVGALALRLVDRLRDEIDDRHADEKHLLYPLLEAAEQGAATGDTAQQIAAVRARLELEQLLTLETLDELQAVTSACGEPEEACEALSELADGLSRLDRAIRAQLVLEDTLVLSRTTMRGTAENYALPQTVGRC